MNSNDLLKISISLGLVVILILGLALLARKMGFGTNRNPNSLRILQRLRLGPRMQLMVIENQGKQLLIGVTPHHISLLDTPEQPIQKAKENFDSLLHEAQQELNKPPKNKQSTSATAKSPSPR